MYNPSTFYIRNFKPLAVFSGCTAQFVSDIARNPEDRFSRDVGQLLFRTNKQINFLYLLINFLGGIIDRKDSFVNPFISKQFRNDAEFFG